MNIHITWLTYVRTGPQKKIASRVPPPFLQTTSEWMVGRPRAHQLHPIAHAQFGSMETDTGGGGGGGHENKIPTLPMSMRLNESSSKWYGFRNATGLPNIFFARNDPFPQATTSKPDQNETRYLVEEILYNPSTMLEKYSINEILWP